MFVPVCDRPSVAEPTGAQDRAVMETRSATIHRKMSTSARQLPITEFAHKAAVVGDDGVRTLLAARDMPAERRRAAALDRSHDLQLVEADVPGVGSAPRRPMVAEDIRDLQRWTGHVRGLLGRRRVFRGLWGLPRLLARLRQQVEWAGDSGDQAGGDTRVARCRIQFVVTEQS
jgi:hypothetical protein